MTLLGKGHYMWQIPKCDGGSPAAITARVVKAGISHVMIKIADGYHWAYNIDQKTKVDWIPPVLVALRQAGVSVWGWQYVRGDSPDAEAELAVQRARGLGIDGFVVDAEIEYKKPGKAAAARRYMSALRAGLGDMPIALSTYRYPKTHPTFPFREFLEQCDLVMPQVYFEHAHNVEEQLERCVEQYLALNPARPIIPTGPTYSHAGWRPIPAEIERFLVRAKSMGLTAANFWAYDFSTRPSFLDLWEAVAAFDWPAGPPLADMPERLVGRINQKDASFVAGLYNENAAHVTAQRTIIGREAIAEWYRGLLSEGLPNPTFQVTGKSGNGATRHFTWTARSDRGSVADGNDTLGLLDGRIQYHYSYFNIR
jgi:hypothetical protein